jgi:protein-tyrosine phosphatase
VHNGLNLHIDSAGTGDWHIGEPPCQNSIKVAKMNGIDITNLRARRVTPDDLKSFDFIVALDENNYADLKAMGATKLVKLGAYGYDGADIPDPYFFNGFEGFVEVFKMIESCVDTLFRVELHQKEK